MNWNRNTPWVFAHRGASGEAPENTLASFRQAILQQCDVIELDIHLTSDGHVVVCHDETLDRTTDRSGSDCRADAGGNPPGGCRFWFDRLLQANEFRCCRSAGAGAG
ncbi:glycerophosphodiester phosphodiesterase [Paenibacillus validus]|uniref:glycerophosphodiester phosphodiesterase n=1 Tax=Paenibacillus validus TaxID=44253 RepID=UPI003D2AB9F0